MGARRVTADICAFPNCGRPRRANGWCGAHNNQASRGGTPRPLGQRARAVGECSFDGCDRPARPNGLCRTHGDQLRRGAALSPISTCRTSEPCAGPGCDRPGNNKGLCSAHRKQQLKGQELRPVGTRGGARIRTGAAPKPKPKPKPKRPPTPAKPAPIGPVQRRHEQTPAPDAASHLDVYASPIIPVPARTQAAYRRLLEARGDHDIADILGLTA
ncbi:MAG: hypothetical protein IPJ61_17735 [Tessaracoccus sp.]|uniref:hypothetical protein n=1 Tax=Tessaracoccus sp. TaxID=1971211 RepID=UPI001ED657F2|nr:hypothetical protein [Tessaracoccus sp.]MBK7822846.1 hypothetical protein [Tessaracoccus sp.]